MLRISEVFYSWSFSERVDTRKYNRIYIHRGGRPVARRKERKDEP